MATLVATEEFALTPQSASQIRPAPVITESTVTKGVKILSRYSGAPVRKLRVPFYHYGINMQGEKLTVR